MSQPLLSAGLAGASEISKVLDKLPRKLGEKALNAALRKGARVVLTAARANAPVGSGAERKLKGKKGTPGKTRPHGTLRKSLRIRKAPRAVSIGAGHVILELGPKGFYGMFLEFGTRSIAARPFLRPAFDANAERVIAVTGEELGKQVTRAATKLAGSFAKSGLSKRRRKRR